MNVLFIQIIVSAVSGLAVCGIGAIFWFGYMRSSIRSAHHRISELQGQINENRQKFETHEGKGEALRERLTKMETWMETVKDDIREIKDILKRRD